jgi:hypothetical protein
VLPGGDTDSAYDAVTSKPTAKDERLMAMPVDDMGGNAVPSAVAHGRSRWAAAGFVLALSLGAGLGGCATTSGYQALPGSTATATPAKEGLSPAEQQKIIDDLKAAKTKSEEQAAAK